MKFFFDKPACQNIRKALRKEWLLTNGLGDYSSGTITGCNTRKYHGMLTVNVAEPAGRHVLLSTLEESVRGGGKEFFFSCRKHPGNYFPCGHEYLEQMEASDWPIFRYRIGNVTIIRELVLVRGQSLLLLRYTVLAEGDVPPLTLCLKPLLAFRHMHTLTRQHTVNTETHPLADGFSVQPEAALPPLYMQAAGTRPAFTPAPDWYYNIEYLVEEERGFPAQEDLFMPGLFTLPIQPGKSILVAASTAPVQEDLSTLWQAETQARLKLTEETADILGHLRREGARFLVNIPHTADKEDVEAPAASPPAAPRLESSPLVLAGYHWFDAWGRDALIALPGLTFAAERPHKGEIMLKTISDAIRNGLVPNLFAMNNQPAAYNSVDASLWYAWAVQQMLLWMPEKTPFLREVCWPALKKIITAFRKGVWLNGECVARVLDNGLLYTGSERTQLTWMDAQANGRPVTPRHGCPVEINALWYNMLAFCDELADRYGETEWRCGDELKRLRGTFRECFWTLQKGGYLGDVWREGMLDTSIRPNQIFAVSLPYAVLDPDDYAQVVECVRNNLLTPYGLRTLSPSHAAYCPRYEGGPTQRDSAYHQGTVWPWLLGAYGEALLKTAWDIENAVTDLLDTLTPLFTEHMRDAGLGSISEIFDGNPPHRADGCIAQAWSVAECYRLLRLIKLTAPEAFGRWEVRNGRS